MKTLAMVSICAAAAGYVAHAAKATNGTKLVLWAVLPGETERRMTPVDGTLEPAGSWQIVAGRGTYALGPCVVRAEEGVTLLFAVEREKNCDIYAVPCGPQGPRKEIRISTSAGADVKPAVAWHSFLSV